MGGREHFAGTNQAKDGQGIGARTYGFQFRAGEWKVAPPIPVNRIY